jgi:hypothetical protein
VGASFPLAHSGQKERKAPVRYNTYTCNLQIMKEKKPREALE